MSEWVTFAQQMIFETKENMFFILNIELDVCVNNIDLPNIHIVLPNIHTLQQQPMGESFLTSLQKEFMLLYLL